ncbi:3-oxoacyl-ACP synthase III family protein [Streptomyces sp. QL37]|uniref:3-oxoacyl-ACP synthase III family protein n=1 Tax=Streptomyces sp. QL37 TaxID=2093747 RepID=UPI000CF2F076|nr:3-oxoacyl-[acyl-carrier-protein] synthase III C-terminal domain-containing protein [Streptomyces sp. QL37]PPQ57543.1 3-oxoacyl-ACP synthase [Streptomyces sp. QL37]
MGGIVDFDVCFPSATADIRDMHQVSGVSVADLAAITHTESFPVLADGETASGLAVRAASRLLDRLGTERSAVHEVIYTGSGEWDIPFWSPAAKVADELGIRNAHCYELTNFCNAGLTAIRLAAESTGKRPGTYTLVLLGDRLSRMVDYGDPDSKALFNFGDAGAAVLLADDNPLFRVLHSAMRTDPGWADYYQGEWRDGRVVIRRGAHRRGLASAYVDNFTRLVDETLTATGRTIGDVAWFLINQGDKGMHERLLTTLGIPAERSVFNYGRLGHMGGADTLIALDGLMEEKKLREGDLILLATSAMGFSWGVTALEYSG